MLPEELKQIVTTSKATTADFAKALGISRSCLNRWMAGHTLIRNIHISGIEQVRDSFLENPPRYKLHQQAPRRRRMK